MLETILNLLVAGIFLNASAAMTASVNLPANTLPLASQKVEYKIPEREASSTSLGVKVTAESFVVVEPQSGAIIYEKNADQSRPIASITKLMTTLVFLQNNPGWDKQIVMQESDYQSGNRPMLLVGDKVTVKDVFYSMLVASSNEAASALARSTGLSPEEFARQMNMTAHILHMDDSHFVEPTGLSDNNKASAGDIIKLINAAFSHSEVRKAATTKKFTVKPFNRDETRVLDSTDQILKGDFGFDSSSYHLEAGKTGFTNAAGYCFASQVKDENNRTLQIAVLGSSSTYDRFTDTKALAYWVFNNYRW